MQVLCTLYSLQHVPQPNSMPTWKQYSVPYREMRTLTKSVNTFWRYTRVTSQSTDPGNAMSHCTLVAILPRESELLQEKDEDREMQHTRPSTTHALNTHTVTTVQTSSYCWTYSYCWTSDVTDTGQLLHHGHYHTSVTDMQCGLYVSSQETVWSGHVWHQNRQLTWCTTRQLRT